MSKKAIITGSSSGIGYQYAKYLSKQGWYLDLISKDQERSKNSEENLSYERANFHVYDLGLKESINSIINTIDVPDLIVANAGIAINGVIGELNPDEKEYYYYLMCGGVIDLIEGYVPEMIKKGSGSIVNLGSVSWMLGEGDKVAYETAKSAVVGLTRSFAKELGKYNIRANSVVPGSIATERQIKHWLTPEYKKWLLDKQCLKRQLKPSDVSSLVLYLASDVSSGCTKQNFIVDAGIT